MMRDHAGAPPADSAEVSIRKRGHRRAGTIGGMSGFLGARFAAAPNALNLVRLLLAAEVVVWHAYSLRGGTWLPSQVETFLADIAVDSFFAISGFLICRAWMRRPELGSYAAARGLRILPGLWVCLLVTAFVVAPAAAWIAGTPTPSPAGQWHYVFGNADTWVGGVWGIDGGPVGVTYAGVWNGCLWSLGFEALCYVAVAILGVTRLLRPAVVAAIAAGAWSLSLLLVDVDATGLVPLAARCALMFASGALLWMGAERVPVDRRLVIGAVAVLVVAALFLPDYRLLAAPAIAYLALVASLRLGRNPRFVLTNDLSYGVYIYGFVLAQAMLMTGVDLPWAPFAALSLAVTLPVAATSWFLVERPAQRLRRRVPRLSAPVLRFEDGQG